VLKRDQILGELELFRDRQCFLIPDEVRTDNENSEREPDEATLLAFQEQHKFNIYEGISQEIKLKLLAVLYKRRKAFALPGDPLGCYNKGMFDIKFKPDCKPVYRKNFPQTAQQKLFIQQHVDLWRSQGICHESHDYRWQSPVFLVPKRKLPSNTTTTSGSGVKGEDPPVTFKDYRLVIDTRLVNETLLLDSILNPPTRELIDQVAGYDQGGKRALVFSSLDLDQAFTQCKLEPHVRPMFSFSDSNGAHWALDRACYGSGASPYIFNNLMNLLFSNQRCKNDFSWYLDDCILFHNSDEIQINRLDEILKIFEDNGLKCSVKKGVFLQRSVQHLGVIIDGSGISPLPGINRTLDMLATKPLRNRKAVLSLLGYFSYWRFFIANFAERSKNLRKLSHLDEPFIVTDACRAEQKDLAEALKNTEPLQPIDPFKRVYVICDSSRVATGFVCAQEVNDVETEQTLKKEIGNLRRGFSTLRPVYHLSYAAGRAERNYGSTALELWGLARAFAFLDSVCVSRVRHVISDNVGVCAYRSLALSNGRCRRLMAYLMRHKIYVYYLKGSLIKPADYLSRSLDHLTPGELLTWHVDDEDVIDDGLFLIKDTPLNPNSANSVTETQKGPALRRNITATGNKSCSEVHATLLHATGGEPSDVNNSEAAPLSGADNQARMNEYDDNVDDDNSEANDQNEPHDDINEAKSVLESSVPTVSIDDYENDVVFGDIYRYLI
jgi:hypothetical protein